MFAAIRKRKRAIIIAFLVLLLAIILSLAAYFSGANLSAEAQSAHYGRINAIAPRIAGGGLVLAVAVIPVFTRKGANKYNMGVLFKVIVVLILFLTLPAGLLVAAYYGESNPPTPRSDGNEGAVEVPTTPPISPTPESRNPRPWDFLNADEDIDEQVTKVIEWLRRNRILETPQSELREENYKQMVNEAAIRDKEALADFPITIKRYISEEESAIQSCYLDELMRADGAIALRKEADGHGKTFANRRQLIMLYESAGDICLRLSDFDGAYRCYQEAYYWCIEALLLADTKDEVQEIIGVLLRLFGNSNDRLGDSDLLEAFPVTILGKQLASMRAFLDKLQDRSGEFLPQRD